MKQQTLSGFDKYGKTTRLVEDERRSPLRRFEYEAQLQRIGSRWSSSKAFVEKLTELDGPAYRRTTRNFRNRASHAIAPRFEIGITDLVTRKIVPATKIEQQGDGTFRSVEIPGKKNVQYGFGGTQPLKLDEALQANAKEFTLAQAAMHAYETLLDELIAASPRTD